MASNTSLVALGAYPSPQAILDANPSNLIKLIQKTSRKSLIRATNIHNSLVEVTNDALKICFLSADATAKSFKIMALYDSYTTQINSVKSQIQAFLESNRVSDDLKNCVALLDTIPGIAFMTAVTLIAEIGDINAFKKPKQLVAFFGIDPSVNQSGKFNITKNKMSKRGTKIGRKFLYSVVLTSIRNKRNGEPNNPILQEYYKENLKGKPKKVAFITIMHKLLKYIFSVLKNQSPFELRDPRVHEKMYLQNNLLVA